MAVITGSALGVALAGDAPIPKRWTPAADALGPATQMWRSPDRRCSFSVITASPGDSSGLVRETLLTALRGQLDAAKLELGPEGRGGRMPISRGNVSGVATLTQQGDNDEQAWQLRACFHRKKDANVCEIHCAKLLAPTKR